MSKFFIECDEKEVEDDQQLKLNPYVTARGGVVILNGPFPIPQAKKVATLCASAQDLLTACEAAREYLKPELDEPGRSVFWMLVAAVAKARDAGEGRP